MIILGLNAYHPDSSACLVKDGKLIAAVEEERFRRIKHWAGFPKEAIKYCLKEGGISFENIDFIVLNRNTKANLHKKVLFAIKKRPGFNLIKNRISNMAKIGSIRRTIAEEFSLPLNNIKAEIFNIEHHRAHLASSFFVSDFDEATLVSIDGFGDFTSCMVAQGKNNKIKVFYEVNYPYSLGIFYSAFTQFLGFPKFGDEYKVMGLSAYGMPRYLKEMEKIVILKPKGRFELNLEYFQHYKTGDQMQWYNTAPSFGRLYSDKLYDLFGPERKKNQEIASYYMDVAASTQAMYEKALFHILNYAYKITGNPNLCLAGGSALNSLANGKIYDNTPFNKIYIQPAAHDAGGAVGAAYYLYNHILDKPRNFIMKSDFWGPEFSEEEIGRTLERMNVGTLEHCRVEKINDEEELCRMTARAIAKGKIVGWFQGRMEWGPRALGNRSILADPRRREMIDILNARIKKREWFRPFAPSILEEYTDEYFEKNFPAPFMIRVYPIKKEKQSVIPAVTHIDGTGRLQTVNRNDNPLYWKLINEFKNLTGVPVLLNTSFNENEPIVCTPEEALDCFLRTKMDILVLGNFILERQ